MLAIVLSFKIYETLSYIVDLGVHMHIYEAGYLCAELIGEAGRNI